MLTDTTPTGIIDGNTMKFITTILVLGLLTVSIFGFVVMDNAGMNCDPSAPNSICPPSQIGMAFHHISSYGSFMMATISPTTKTTFSMVLLLIVAVISIQYILLNQILTSSRLYSRKKIESSQSKKIIHWLSLFENSPSTN